MEKESYNIDDILSEVKKRREENERAIRGEVHVEDEPDFSLQNEEFPPEDNAALEINELGESPETEPAPFENAEIADIHEIGEGAETTPVTDGDLDISVVGGEPDEEPAYEPEPDFEQVVKGESAAPGADELLADEPEPDDIVSDNQDGGEMVDLLSIADGAEKAAETAPEEEKATDAKAKKGKGARIAIIVLAVLIVLTGLFGFFYANGLLNKITGKSDAEPYEKKTYYNGMDFLQEDFPSIDEMSANEVYSYKEYLKQWYKNGDPVSSTHVLNILLIGEDTRGEDISDTSRADSAIIASVNIDTQEIHLTSVLRDLYVYFETDFGNESTGQYAKINAAASNGGMQCYINTLERYYKISIDNYAVVNFASFPKIIDALGGVTLKITSAEINEINNHPKRYGGVTITQDFEGDEGKMLLTGKQALAYCRIRKIDSDGARADRQKTVLNALFKKMQKAGTVDAVKVVNKLIDYVYTGLSKKELVEIGNTALRDGWLNYDVKSVNLPQVKNCKGGQNFSVAPNNWIWLSDIPADAYDLQMSIYGKSNVNLNPDRPDYIAIGR